MSSWFYQVGPTEVGPLTPGELIALAKDGRLRKDDLVRRSDGKEWSPASRVKGLFEPEPQRPPPIPPSSELNTHAGNAPMQLPSVQNTLLTALPESFTVTSRFAPQSTSFIQGSLISGERVIYQAKLHKWIFIRPVVFFVLTSILGLILSEVMMSGMSQRDRQSNSSWKFLLGLILPLLGTAVAFLLVWLRYRFTELAVTNKRVLGKVGFLSITSLELLLTKVEGIEVHQSLTGKLLDFGTVIVSATGGSRTPFKEIAAPFACRRAVQQQAAVIQGG